MEALGLVIGGIVLTMIGISIGGRAMLKVIKDRINNLIQLITSKKVIVGVAAVAAIIYAADLAKIIAVGTIAVVYMIAQGLIDLQKEKTTQKK